MLAGALGTTLGGALVVAPGLKKPADSNSTSEHNSSDEHARKCSLKLRGSKQKKSDQEMVKS